MQTPAKMIMHSDDGSYSSLGSDSPLQYVPSNITISGHALHKWLIPLHTTSEPLQCNSKWTQNTWCGSARNLINSFFFPFQKVHKNPSTTEQLSAAHADTTRSPPSTLLCQLLVRWVNSPQSLNIIWFSVFELTVTWNRQTDHWDSV